MFGILFVTFCKVDFHKMRAVKWHVWIGLFQVMFVVLIVAMIIHFGISGSSLILCEAVLVCIIAPCAAAAPVVTQKLGGNLEQMTTYTFLSNFITALLIPICFPLIEPSEGITFVPAFLKILREVCLVLVLGLTGLELVKPMIIGQAIDRYITGESSEILQEEGREEWAPGERAEERFRGVLTAGGLYLAALVLLMILNRSQTLLLQKMGQDIIYEIRNDLFRHTESLTMRFFDITPVGKIVTRLTNDVEAINEVFSNILVKLFRNVVKMAGLAVIMISLNPRMALYSFILLPVVAALTLVFRMISRKTYRLVRTRLTALNTFLSEHLSGMKVIRIFGREQKKYDEFEQKNASLYNASFREMMVFAVFRPGIYLLSVLALMIIMLTGGREVLEEAARYAVNDGAKAAIARLIEISRLVADTGNDRYISYDFGLLSKFHYYTGMIFSAFTYGVGEPVAKGGRYDRLLGHFGMDAPAVGVGVSIDQLMNALARKRAEKEA